jgi:L-malate glycosyltransferase
MVSNLSLLHICGDFAKQSLYVHLISQLAEKYISQKIYSPVRTEMEAKWSSTKISGIEHHLHNILNKSDRIFFRRKIMKIFHNLTNVINLSEIDLIHAHFLYSDGAVALQIKKNYGIPFVTAIRNTDVNFFMRYRRDLKWLRDEILLEANRLIFISPAYKQKLLGCIGSVLRKKIAGKCEVIPNGIDESWLQSTNNVNDSSNEVLKLLYVGDFSKNKNIFAILKVTELILKENEVELTIVGGGGDGERKVLDYLNKVSAPQIKYLGKISDRKTLQDIYGQHDIFIMPSFNETFGLVYIEALSQGLPIIHSRGQGIDGFFPPGTIAESVDPYSVSDIKAKIEILEKRRPVIKESCIANSKRFAWPLIAKQYKELYEAAIDRTRLHTS